jgi:plastocyanin
MMLRKSVYAVIAFVMIGCGGGGGDKSTGVTGGTGGTTGGDGGGGTSTCPVNSICMTGSAFVPSSLTVPRGTVVSFVNNSGTEHNVTFTANAPTGGNIPTYSSGSVSRTMATSGTSSFYCTIHGTPSSGMTAQIIVQ